MSSLALALALALAPAPVAGDAAPTRGRSPRCQTKDQPVAVGIHVDQPGLAVEGFPSVDRTDHSSVVTYSATRQGSSSTSCTPVDQLTAGRLRPLVPVAR